MKEFNTAVDEAVIEEAPLEFMIDGQEVRAFRPTDGQMAMLMASMGRHTSEATRLAGIIDFFVTVMDDESHQYVVDRLLSRTDPLGLEQVTDVMMWMIEEWSGRPTPPPSGSTSSPESGGRKSKPRTTRSTSSRSVPASSST